MRQPRPFRDQATRYRYYASSSPPKRWPTLRLDHLLDDDAASAHQVSAATDLSFRGGRGLCVIDDYVTNVDHHPFREIARFVQAAKRGSVVIAAAPPSDRDRFGPALELAVDRPNGRKRREHE